MTTIAPTTTLVALPASPYRGLVPFGDSPQDGRFFVGREGETEIVAANLVAARLTVLYGATGVGKSSLLRAGVARRLREEAGSPPEHVVVVVSSWRDDPLAAIAAAVTDAVRAHGGGELPPARSLAALLADATERLDAELLLVLDQVDEYFLYHPDGAGGLEDELPEVVNDPELRVNVLLGVREDALARLDAFKSRIPRLFGNYHRLDHLDEEAARRAIVEPLERWADLGGDRVTAEPALVEALVHEVAAGRIEVAGPGRPLKPASGRVEAPYLQLVLERLWEVERAAGSNVLRLETLRELGGAERIVREHLERAVAVLGSEGTAVAAAVFPHLVTPSRTKVAHTLDDLAAWADVPRDRLAEVVSVLVGERILRPLAPDAAGAPRYELYHDVLAEAALAFALRRRQEHAVEMERARARHRHRKLARVAGGAVALATVMVAIAAWALALRAEAREQARAAKASALAAAATAELDYDPELALLLASDAIRTQLSPAALHAAQRAYLRTQVTGVLRGERPLVAARIAGGEVVAVDRGGTVRRWRRDGTSLSARRLAPLATVAAFSGDGGTVAVGATGRVFVDGPAGRVEIELDSPPVRALALDETGRRLAVLPTVGRIDVHDTRTGRRIDTVPLRRPGQSVAFGSGGALVVTVGDEVVVADERGARTAVVDREFLNDAALSPDGSLLATASTDGAGRIWDTASGGLRRELQGHGNQVTSVAWSPDGLWVVTGSDDGAARAYRADDAHLGATLLGHRGSVVDAVFADGGETVVTAASDGTARLWRPASLPQLERLASLGAWVVGLGWLADGRVLAVGEDGGSAAVAPGGRATLRPASPSAAAAAAVDPAGRLVAVASGNRVEVRRAPFRRVESVLRHPVAVQGVAFGGSGRVVTSAQDGVVRLFGPDGRVLRELRGAKAPTAVALSHDGRTAAAADGHRVHVWDTGSGRALPGLRGHAGDVTSVRFAPDDSRLVTAGADNDARVWTARTGALLLVLKAHFGRVADASFSPDGRWIVTAGPITAGLWRAGDGRFLLYLREHGAALTFVRFDPTGRFVATADRDGEVKLYPCEVCAPPERLLELARRKLAVTGRTLTAAQRDHYLSGE